MYFCNLQLRKPVLLTHMFPHVGGGYFGTLLHDQYNFVLAWPGWLRAPVAACSADFLYACAYLNLWSIDVIRRLAACRVLRSATSRVGGQFRQSLLHVTRLVEDTFYGTVCCLMKF